MHDKPTDETRPASDGSPGPSRAEALTSMAELPGLLAELTTVDPAQAPDIADEIAAALETSLDAAPGSAAGGDDPGPSAAPETR